jgi:CHAT domain-containing protein
VTWCATGPLAFLPIHAAGEYGSRGGGLKVYDFVVSSYTTSLSALLRPSLVRAPNLQSPASKILVVSQPATPFFGSLPGCLEEVAKLENIFSPEALIHLNHGDATVKAVQEAMSSDQCQLVHLACHGLQHHDDPLKSAFALYDGQLELSQIMSRSTDGGALAFLSACETATGDAKVPDEVVHLAAGMLSAGYRAVVGTMWSIGDQDAPLVADEVYRYLKADQAKGGEGGQLRVAHAVYEGTRILRNKVGEADVLKWAPFVHFGQ